MTFPTKWSECCGSPAFRLKSARSDAKIHERSQIRAGIAWVNPS